MKKLFLLLSIITLLCGCLPAPAQTLSGLFAAKNHLGKYKKIPAVKIRTTTPTVGTTGTILLLTPSVAVNLSRVENVNGKWSFAGQIAPGLLYSFVVGSGTQNADGSVSVVPYFSLGVYVDAGAVQSVPANGVIGSVTLGGVIGIYKYLQLLAGYDVVNRVPIFGVGANVSLFTFTSGPGALVLNDF